eukprot:5454124-Pyramimonas_sp.AAC.1
MDVSADGLHAPAIGVLREHADDLFHEFGQSPDELLDRVSADDHAGEPPLRPRPEPVGQFGDGPVEAFEGAAG